MPDFNFKPKKSPDDFGWYGQSNLPHLDADEVTQFITFRLADSMPRGLVEKWRGEGADDILIRKRVEKYLDLGYGACWLRDERVAAVVRDALLFHAGKKYDLNSWVLMPNHAHVLLAPLPGIHLPAVLHSIKSFSAQKANGILGRKGEFWQRSAFDRYIRDYRHYNAVVKYIINNPVKAGLCAHPEDWRFSSAYAGTAQD